MTNQTTDTAHPPSLPDGAAMGLPSEVTCPAESGPLDTIAPAEERDPQGSGGNASAAPPDPTGAAGRNIETFGSFFIEDTEFALPVSVISEVVNEPKTLSPIPLSPSYMIGLFNLGGMIVPMIDLRDVFGFPPAPSTGERKVTIIEDGEMYIGLVFDRTGEVVHTDAADRVTFQKRTDGLKDVLSTGVLKLDQGKRLMQVLDPYEMLKLERVPRLHKDRLNVRNATQKGKLLHCLAFEVGHSKYAFNLEYVQEVMEVPEIKKSFLSHGYVLGSISRRGRIIPVVDFRGFVGKQKTDVEQIRASKSNKLLIMNLLEGQIGLLVYSIDSIVRYYEKDVLPISRLAMPREAIFSGCLTIGNSDLIMLFDHDETMNQPELIAAAQCCQDLYPDGREIETKKAAGSRQRRTFITFHTDCEYAMDISEVREVVERPPELMKPPNAPKAVIGLFNRRDEVITLMDLRILYDAAPSKSLQQKVIIFDHGGTKYGIVVDSVSGIIMTTSDMVVPFKANAGHLSEGPAAPDVTEMVQFSSGQDGLSSVMVLDVQAFVTRGLEG